MTTKKIEETQNYTMHRPTNNKLYSLIFTCVVCAFGSCSTSSKTAGYKKLTCINNNIGFTTEVPSGWYYLPKQGIDSYIGIITTNTKDTIHFAIGMYGISTLPMFNLPEEERYSTKEKNFRVNEFEVTYLSHRYKKNTDFSIRIDSAWTTNEPDDIITGNDMKFILYGLNLSKEIKKEMKKSIKSIQFIH